MDDQKELMNERRKYKINDSAKYEDLNRVGNANNRKSTGDNLEARRNTTSSTSRIHELAGKQNRRCGGILKDDNTEVLVEVVEMLKRW